LLSTIFSLLGNTYKLLFRGSARYYPAKRKVVIQGEDPQRFKVAVPLR